MTNLTDADYNPFNSSFDRESKMQPDSIANDHVHRWKTDLRSRVMLFCRIDWGGGEGEEG